MSRNNLNLNAVSENLNVDLKRVFVRIQDVSRKLVAQLCVF